MRIKEVLDLAGDHHPVEAGVMGYMLGAALDVFRLRQYFNVITRTREFVEGVRGRWPDQRRPAGTTTPSFPSATRARPPSVSLESAPLSGD